jgi:phosphoribosyl 1,2-cyclic phosphodiesterase
MEIRLWGTRGSIAAPGPDTVRYGGNTTCVDVLLEGGERVIIDAGSGLRVLGLNLMKSPEPLRCHLLITHIHWDHIMGFPFFVPIYRKDTHIWLDGCARALQGLRMTLNKGMVDGVFPVDFDDLSARIEPLDCITRGPLRIGGAVVDGIELQHPQGGMGFRMQEGDRRFVFLTDNELRPDAWIGRAPADFASFCEGADLLIHDAQYRPDEMADKHGWGHSDWESTVDLAGEAGVGRLLLTHHDPDRSDAEVDDMVRMARVHATRKGMTKMHVDAAREGATIRV